MRTRTTPTTLNVWPSSKGLSVWNMLSVEGRDLTAPEILALLRKHWSQRIDRLWVEAGIEFLARRGMVTCEGEIVRVNYPRDPRTNAAPKVEKTRDERELVVYPTRPGLTWSAVQHGVRSSTPPPESNIASVAQDATHGLGLVTVIDYEFYTGKRNVL